MKQKLFFDEAIRLVKIIWSCIVLSGLCISLSLTAVPIFWFGVALGYAICICALFVFWKKADLIRKDSYAIMPQPFKTSSFISLLVGFIVAIVSDKGILNPWAIGFISSGISFAIAKMIEPEYYWLLFLESEICYRL